LLYLYASGDFNEEANRLVLWLNFFKTKDDIYFADSLLTVLNLAEKFTKLASLKLAPFTENVESFQKMNRSKYYNQENRIFVNRPENEYHLNMVAAEILNRSFFDEFHKANTKIVLLPTCMQKNPATCRSSFVDGERKCVNCNDNCYINTLDTKLKKYGVETRLIPHSSQFSEFLKKWEDNKSVGLVGTACVLNLIKGGYEMRKLNIPSQCVFLDYCGCKNHWHNSGIPTKLNLNRLLKILHVQHASEGL
jgi:hypothetical protein